VRAHASAPRRAARLGAVQRRIALATAVLAAAPPLAMVAALAASLAGCAGARPPAVPYDCRRFPSSPGCRDAYWFCVPVVSVMCATRTPADAGEPFRNDPPHGFDYGPCTRSRACMRSAEDVCRDASPIATCVRDHRADRACYDAIGDPARASTPVAMLPECRATCPVRLPDGTLLP
jgi:hypothetical protein